MKFVLLHIIVLLPLTASAQDWGDKRIVQFDSIPYTVDGFYNPSYCVHDSLLYFDTFSRSLPNVGGIIYVSRFEGRDEYQNDIWSNPISTPPPVNLPGYNNIMPDISASGDTLFFSSNRPGTLGGYDIWTSIKVNGNWSEPINLGDSINTNQDEFAPDFSPISHILFFDRFDSASFLSNIFSAQRLGDTAWSQSVILPTVINIPSQSTFGPAFDESRQALYFSSITGLEFEPIYRSYYSNGEWSPPTALGNNVNGFYYPNYCNRVSTENPDITANGQKLFYNKLVWEASYCIDYYSFIFYSERLPEAIEERENDRLTNDMNVYPNPFNSSTVIEYDLAVPSQVSIGIFDIQGRRVETIEQGRQPAGPHSVIWHAGGRSSGIYFYRVKAGNKTETRKMVLIK